METPESIRASVIPGEWVSLIDLSERLPSHPHPPKLKEVPKVLPQVTGVPVHLPSIRASHGPSGLYNDCKRSEADGPDKGNQSSPVPGRLAYQGPVSGRSTSKHSDSCRPNSVLRVDNKSGVVRTKTYSGVFIRGLQILLARDRNRKIGGSSGIQPFDYNYLINRSINILKIHLI